MGLAHFFIEAIFDIMEDVGALLNLVTIDHFVFAWLKMDPIVDLDAKAIQSTNWGSILLARDMFYGVKPTSRYNKISVEHYNP